MPITPLLRNQSFDPDQIEAMSAAFVRTCETLGLTDTTDQITELVARYIIETAQRGICTSAELYARAMQEFKPSA